MRDDAWEHAPRIKANIEGFEVVDEVQSVLWEVDCWRRGVLKETSRKYAKEVIRILYVKNRIVVTGIIHTDCHQPQVHQVNVNIVSPIHNLSCISRGF